MSVESDTVCCLPSQIASFVPNICRGHMDIPKQQEQSAEERIVSVADGLAVRALPTGRGNAEDSRCAG
jgi:hypothetical protein